MDLTERAVALAAAELADEAALREKRDLDTAVVAAGREKRAAVLALARKPVPVAAPVLKLSPRAPAGLLASVAPVVAVAAPARDVGAEIRRDVAQLVLALHGPRMSLAPAGGGAVPFVLPLARRDRLGELSPDDFEEGSPEHARATRRATAEALPKCGPVVVTGPSGRAASPARYVARVGAPDHEERARDARLARALARAAALPLASPADFDRANKIRARLRARLIRAERRRDFAGCRMAPDSVLLARALARASELAAARSVVDRAGYTQAARPCPGGHVSRGWERSPEAARTLPPRPTRPEAMAWERAWTGREHTTPVARHKR